MLVVAVSTGANANTWSENKFPLLSGIQPQKIMLVFDELRRTLNGTASLLNYVAFVST